MVKVKDGKVDGRRNVKNESTDGPDNRGTQR